MEETQSPQSGEQPSKPNRAGLLYKLGLSLLLAGLLGFFFSVPGGGFGVIFIIIPQIVLIPMRLFIGVVNPDERWLNLGRVIIWLVAIASIYLVHHVREDLNRKYAQEIVAQLEDYSADHGKCAARIEDVGISTQELHEKLGYSGYYCEDGKPHFFHRGSFMMYSFWSYDFINRTWHYHSD